MRGFRPVGLGLIGLLAGISACTAPADLAENSAAGSDDVGPSSSQAPTVGELQTVSASGGTSAGSAGVFSGGSENGAASLSLATVLPNSIALEIAELPDDDALAKDSGTALSYDNLGIRRTIAASASIVGAFHRLADRSLALGRAIRLDAASPAQTQVQGSLLIDGAVVQYKADFAPFDIDGDGAADGSGNAIDAPVALRVWADRGAGYEPWICALVTEKPSSTDLGSGQLFVRPAAAQTDAFSDFQFHVVYDRTDAAHKWNDAYLSGPLTPFYAVSIGHERVDLRSASDGSTEKTVRANNDLTQSYAGLENYTFASHWRVGEPFALVSAHPLGGNVQVDFSQVCFNLSTGIEALPERCTDFDQQDSGFLADPVGNETQFPADFPASPTF